MLRIADVFCGMGSFNVAAEQLDMRCVYACDNDPNAQKVYMSQFGIVPEGDIRKIDYARVPEHDILCIGFPCITTAKNATSPNNTNEYIISRAFEILKRKKPKAFIHETTRSFNTSNNGEDMKNMERMVKECGYEMQCQLLKCEDFGIPQSRHRMFIVGFIEGHGKGFKFPSPTSQPSCPTLSEFLDMDIVKPLSNTVRGSGRNVGVDHPKNWSAYKLKDGTIFEYELEHALKMQGFPDDFEWAGIPEVQRWKLVGNTIPTCLSKAILEAVKSHLLNPPVQEKRKISEVENVEEPEIVKKKPIPCTITIKSGTMLCLTLPPGTDEQTYFLKIIS